MIVGTFLILFIIPNCVFFAYNYQFEELGNMAVFMLFGIAWIVGPLIHIVCFELTRKHAL